MHGGVKAEKRVSVLILTSIAGIKFLLMQVKHKGNQLLLAANELLFQALCIILPDLFIETVANSYSTLYLPC